MAIVANITTPSTVTVSNAVTNPTGTPGTAGQSIEIRGAWALSTVYVYRDVVYHNGVSYVCSSNHTATATREPGVGATWTGKWENFAASPINDGASGSSTTYSSSKIETELALKADSSHSHSTADVNTGTFADSLVAESNVTQHVNAIDHDQLLNYTAAQHRTINDAGSGTTDLWSANQIIDQLGNKADTVHTHGVTDLITGQFSASFIPEAGVTQHEGAIDHGNLAGLGDNDHSSYPTNSITGSLFTSPGNDYGVPPQNVITGADDGHGLLGLTRATAATTLPTNTNVELFPIKDGTTLIGGWIDSNGGYIGSGEHAISSPSGDFWLWDGISVIGPNGGLWLEDQTRLRFYESAVNGDYYLSFRAPSDMAGLFDYVLPKAPTEEGQALRVQYSGGSAGAMRWESNSGSAFPTTDLYTGRRFLRTDNGQWWTYYDGTAWGSPAVPAWVSDETVTLAWGDNASRSSPGTFFMDTVGNAGPGAADMGYTLDADMYLVRVDGNGGSSTSWTGAMRINRGSTTLTELTISGVSGMGSGAMNDDLSAWVKCAKITSGTNRINSDFDVDTGTCVDPVITAVFRPYIEA